LPALTALYIQKLPPTKKVKKEKVVGLVKKQTSEIKTIENKTKALAETEKSEK